MLVDVAVLVIDGILVGIVGLVTYDVLGNIAVLVADDVLVDIVLLTMGGIVTVDGIEEDCVVVGVVEDCRGDKGTEVGCVTSDEGEGTRVDCTEDDEVIGVD